MRNKPHVCEECHEAVSYEDIRDAYGNGERAVCVDCFKDMERCVKCGYAMYPEDIYHINLTIGHFDCLTAGVEP